MLKLTNVDISYGKVRAVRRASLHIDQGEIVALIGANGAGKTTLLSCISGLIRPGSGSLVFEGRDLSKLAPEKIVKLGLSHVPERRLVFKPLSVADNLLLGAYTRIGFGGKSKVESELQEVYELFPVLQERANQAAGTLSGGEQQMLAIGRALMAKPKLLLLDEPGMGLAPTICKEIFRRVLQLRDQMGLTVLLVEQNAKSALEVSDRGYVLETGRVILDGTSEELAANRDVRRAYLGRDKDAA